MRVIRFDLNHPLAVVKKGSEEFRDDDEFCSPVILRKRHAFFFFMPGMFCKKNRRSTVCECVSVESVLGASTRTNEQKRTSLTYQQEREREKEAMAMQRLLYHTLVVEPVRLSRKRFALVLISVTS